MSKFFTYALFFAIMTSCNQINKIDKAEYSGNDISDKVYIQRDKITKEASLIVNIDGKWELYAGPNVDEIDFNKSIAEGDSKGTFILDVSDSVRSYFQIITPEGKAILAEKHLPMDGGYNFRDMGGYKTTDGRYTKWGKVFRSDDLYKLTIEDLNYLSSIPIISIIDFRSDEEIKTSPDNVPSSVNEKYELSISPGNLSSNNLKSINDLKGQTAEQTSELMGNIYKALVTDSASINQYKSYFDVLQKGNEIPVMFHCSAGKDRTGIAAALFLFSLGVDEKTILNDYLLSNEYLGDKYAYIIEKEPNIKPFMIVEPEYLTIAIEQIKKDHGSVNNYLENTLHVDLDKMKELYLYN